MSDVSDDASQKPEDGDSDDELLKKADVLFKRGLEAIHDNHERYEADYRFARLAEQWDESLQKIRRDEERPCLTNNHLPSFIRQVVNDCRQNKPSIKVSPVDSGADPKTAEVFDGVIRNIEQESQADIAYDTAVDCAASGGFGYFRINIDYAHDDTFDMDLRIERIVNPLTVIPDPFSTAGDSSDWNNAFIIDSMSCEEFEQAYPDAEKVDWKGGDFQELPEHWRDGEDIIRAEWWHRKEVTAELLMISNGQQNQAIRKELYERDRAMLFDPFGFEVKEQRSVKSWKVCQYVMTGAEILEKKEWAGKFIPIIPVYGEELNLKGKRYFLSLIHNAKDAQRYHNYMRSMSAELTALAPRAPYIGEDGAFDVDPNWSHAHKTSVPYLKYKKGLQPPQRQPMDIGSAMGVLAEAKLAIDDMKSILGLYDASLGARSNETSGKAINARKVEGEVSTFHFPDNLARAVAHGGRILLDLIPLVYSPGRIVRTLGLDGTAKPVQVGDPGKPALNQPTQGGEEQPAEGVTEVYYLGRGKYDLAVKAGPSFTTRRQEAAMEMTELIRAYPQAAPVIGDLLVKNLDWPGADEIAKRMKALVPVQAGASPEVTKMIEEGKKIIAELQKRVQELEANGQNEAKKLVIEAYNAQTKRIQVTQDIMAPSPEEEAAAGQMAA
jgi:hypothetical protein